MPPMYNNYGYYPQNFMAQQVQQQTQQPIQSSGFIAAPNEAYVHNYPVAPGNCVSFKIEGQPIVLEKSMGFSQFDSPKIERFRLVKEEITEKISQDVLDSSQNNQSIDLSSYALKTDIEKLRQEFEAFKRNMEVVQA